jgi:hypothetical protein
MRPYQNEADAIEIGDLKIENRLDRVTVFGRIDLTRDKAGLEKAGLENARALKRLLDDVVRALERDPVLPEHIAPPQASVMKRNPFA